MNTPPAVRRELIVAVVWLVVMICGCLLIGLYGYSTERWNVAD